MTPLRLTIFFALALCQTTSFAQEVEPLGSRQTSDQSGEFLKAVCNESEEAISIKIGDQPFLTYHTAIVLPPVGIDAIYKKSGYIHPIQSPTGRCVTGDFAPSHAHQHGFFLAWVKTKFAGHSVDFWNQKNKTGRVAHSKVIAVNNSNEFAEFEVELSHEDISNLDQPVQVLSERWKVRAYHGHKGQPFVFDIESHQTCVAQTALTLRQYHYGGLGLRGNEVWHKPDAKGQLANWKNQFKAASDDPEVAPPKPLGLDVAGHGFLTSQGKRRHDGNHTTARWTAIYGAVDGGLAGVAILCHPENFRAPQPVRLHPAEPYFSVSPVVAGEFEIRPKETYSARFRVVSFDGRPDAKVLNQIWDVYAKVSGQGDAKN